MIYYFGNMKVGVLIIVFLISILSVPLFSQRDSIIRITKSIESSKERIQKWNSLTELSWRTGTLDDGIQYANLGIKDAKKHSFLKLEANIRNNLGIIYDYKGNYPLALKHFFKALEIQEEIGDKNGEAYSLSNIGLIYSNEKNWKEALKYHSKSLNIRKDIRLKSGVSSSMNNIGIVYLYQLKYDKALYFFKKSLEIDNQLKDSIALMDGYNNLGICYMNTERYDSALLYLKKSMELRSYFNDELGRLKALNNIATIYEKRGDLKLAKEHFLAVIEDAEELGSIESLAYCYAHLTDISLKENNFENAFKYQTLATRNQDKLTNLGNARKETEIALNYRFSKERELDQIRSQKKELELRKRQEKTRLLLIGTAAILTLIILFSVLLYKRYRRERLLSETIDLQRKMVQEKNEEILDSITYAQRIQRAILPDFQVLKKNLPQHFIYYLPKDIVAGDFYWLQEQDDWKFFAVADCTGHGVPGALMSVLCSNKLNLAVNAFKLNDPGEILNKTRELIIAELSNTDEEVKDGMDISLIAMNAVTNELKWAGANNNCWLISPVDGQLTEFKANKQPIGTHFTYEPFTTHIIPWKKGDLLYMYTDGFADQFGGQSGKKFKTKQFKDLLLANCQLPLDEQQKSIVNAFDSWKGTLEQVDDVTVVGIQL